MIFDFVRSSARRERVFGGANIFQRRKNFRKKSLGRRERFRPRIVKIGAILAIFEPFEVQKFCMPFFGEFSRSSQDLRESDYDAIKSWDDRPNSPKSGMWILGGFDRTIGDVLLGTQEMSCWEHRRCLAWSTGDALLQTQEMSRLEYRRRPAWNTRNVLLGTQGMSCLEHRECLAWKARNVLFGTHELSRLEHRECPAWNIRNVLRGKQGVSCLEDKECFAWNTGRILRGSQRICAGNCPPQFIWCTVSRKRAK